MLKVRWATQRDVTSATGQVVLAAPFDERRTALIIREVSAGAGQPTLNLKDSLSADGFAASPLLLSLSAECERGLIIQTWYLSNTSAVSQTVRVYESFESEEVEDVESERERVAAEIESLTDSIARYGRCDPPGDFRGNGGDSDSG